ncbi:putative RNA recognition motif domain, nucleotide-binding alpha-beta plait domain superfamily [Helianthus annuus]|nr:putative RNA recognition motif domain, nucleotide-binding alpha-beta plait domain superfamily [Helianthus annuus]
MVITKYFVANLPEGCTPWELRKALEGYGDIAGTYVAKKKDKGGGRFGFVSFANVRDRSELESSLRGARMGDNKLKVNIARFAVENAGFGAQKEARAKVGVSDDMAAKPSSFNVRDSRSYSEVLGKTKNYGNGAADVGSCNRSIEKTLVVPDRTVAFKDLYGLALVGRAVDLETLVDIDRLLGIAKTEYSRIRYLGGLTILISFKNIISARDFLNDRTVWGPWFTKLETWNGQSLSLERVVWLKVHGIPLHIFDPGLIKQIGGIFGKVLHFPKSLDDEHDLTVIRVGVLGGESFRIRENIVLKWKDRSYRVWVEEEEGAWVPDFLERSESTSSGDASPLQSSPVVQVPVEPDDGNEEAREMESRPVEEGSGISLPKGDMGKGGSNNDRSAEGAFNDLEEGSTSKVVGDNSRNIFFFESKKRTKRYRKKGGRAQSIDPLNSHGDFLDSSENSRPNKRNRAQSSHYVEDVFINRARKQLTTIFFPLIDFWIKFSKKRQTMVGERFREMLRQTPALHRYLGLRSFVST